MDDGLASFVESREARGESREVFRENEGFREEIAFFFRIKSVIFAPYLHIIR